MISIDPVYATGLEDSLVVGIQSTKTLTVRPLLPLERDMLSVYNLVYESLIYIDDNYTPQGLLAESWEQTGNGKNWTFHLRQGLTFSDGTPLTATDVVASARYILDRANDDNTTDHGFYSNLKFFVSSVSATDDLTVVFKAKRRYIGLLYEMTFPIVPASMVDDDNPPGSGPYRIREFIPKDYLWLEANQYWWKAQPQVREIMFSCHETQKAIIDSYEYARVDAAFSRSIASTQYKTGTSSLSVSFRTNQLECLLMNNSASELTKNARIAIRYVIDKDRIVSGVYSGLVRPADLPFFPGTWMYNDSLSPMFVRNVDAAKKLLEADGWEDSDEDGILDKVNAEGKLQKFHLRFYVYEEPENDVRVEAANKIADMLSEVGISCKVEAMTMTNLREKFSAGSYDLALVSFAMDVCPDPGFMLMKGNTGNYTRYRNDRMTELFDDLRTKLSQEEYRQKLLQIQALYAEDCPFVCLYWRMGNVLTRHMYTTVRDVREYELLRGIQDFKQ